MYGVYELMRKYIEYEVSHTFIGKKAKIFDRYSSIIIHHTYDVFSQTIFVNDIEDD